MIKDWSKNCLLQELYRFSGQIFHYSSWLIRISPNPMFKSWPKPKKKNWFCCWPSIHSIHHHVFTNLSYHSQQTGFVEPSSWSEQCQRSRVDLHVTSQLIKFCNFERQQRTVRNRTTSRQVCARLVALLVQAGHHPWRGHQSFAKCSARHILGSRFNNFCKWV